MSPIGSTGRRFVILSLAVAIADCGYDASQVEATSQALSLNVTLDATTLASTEVYVHGHRADQAHTITAVDTRSWLGPGLLCAALYFAMSYPLARLARRLKDRLGPPPA